MEVSRRDFNSVLRQNDFESLSTLDFEEIVRELENSCPFSYKVLSVMIDEKYNRDKKIAPLSTIYSMIMFQRCHEMSKLQRINTVLLAESDANTEVVCN